MYVSESYNLNMGRKEILTDLWVYEMLKEANIDLHPQGSNIKEIDEAKTASKQELEMLIS